MSESMVVGLLGFGEVGQALAGDLHRTGVEVRAWDIRFPDPASAPSRALRTLPFVTAAATATELAAGCPLVVSAVTAAEDQAATVSILPGLEPGSYVMDLNSVAPSTRESCAALVTSARGRYVEAAVMSPIHPRGAASPVLLGGPDAADFLPLARSIGFTGSSVCSSSIGIASATKMCRSVIIKGIEALFTESMLTARHYGVEDAVLDSLRDLWSTRDPRDLAKYMIERSIEHGERRAEEMREVAVTVRDAGVDAWMSLASVQRQAWAAGFPSALHHPDLPSMLDSIRSETRC